MKSGFQLISFVALLGIGCFGFLSTAGSPAASAATIESSGLASAYANNCAACHGSDGRSNTAKGRDLDADDLTTAKVQGMSTSRLAKIIRNGKGDMPGFKKLTAAQVSQIIRTVKSF